MKSVGLLGCKLSPCQAAVFQSPYRFRILAAGRRFGKTHLALAELVEACWLPNRLGWYVAPNRAQAKRIAWRRLKSLTRHLWKGKPSETQLRIELRNGSALEVVSGFNPDNLRGAGVDFVVLDEYASMKPTLWTDVVRPCLADRNGRALFIGTPKGANHFYRLFDDAQNRPGWQTFQFSTQQGGNVSPEELLALAQDLDPRTYSREIEAKFDGLDDNRVYHAFKPSENVKSLQFTPGQPLVWTLDFNVEPQCAVLAQKIGEEIRVLKEIVIPKNANTQAACEQFEIATREYRRWGLIKLEVYGDASGNQRRTSSLTTDWNIVAEFFTKYVGVYAPTIKPDRSNPTVRDRVNCVNGRLQNTLGERRLFVDPSCKELILDLQKVTWALDDNGMALGVLDKSDGRRTHASDALGYYIAALYAKPRGKVGLKDDGRIQLGGSDPLHAYWKDQRRP